MDGHAEFDELLPGDPEGLRGALCGRALAHVVSFPDRAGIDALIVRAILAGAGGGPLRPGFITGICRAGLEPAIR